MALYLWRSQYLKRYSLGYIVVSASTPDEARAKAQEHFNFHVLDHVCHAEAITGTNSAFVPSIDQEEMIAQAHQALTQDISVEPIILSDETIFINGSE